MFDLYNIKDDTFLSGLSEAELKILASEVRDFIVDKVSIHGGHLSPNLGIVELTIALHKHYSNRVSYIFDVGHQAYTHKILTGRGKLFDTLRTLDGLSGIVSKEEDPISDIWSVGHSSTSLSALYGFCLADKPAIAIIGDGAMSGGEAYEGLELLSRLNKNALIVLNENYMSISPNNGAIKTIQDKKTFFNLLGIDYIGPIDGHNYFEIEKALFLADKKNKPVVVHVLTKKGKGYKYSEKDEIGKWHATGPFNISDGTPKVKDSTLVSYSQAVASYLSQFYAKTGDLLVINPAMTVSEGMYDLMMQMGDDYIDTGITEQSATTLAAALSINRKNVFLSLFSSFGQRAFDQLISDIACQNLHVVIGLDKVGLVSETGKTHQGIYDLAYLNAIPNLTILSPKDYKELYECLDYAFLKEKGPIVIRYPQSKVKKESLAVMTTNMELKWDKALQLSDPKAYLITYSSSVDYLFDTAKELNVELINAKVIRPLDEKTLMELAKTNKRIYVYEEAPYNNSLASMILSFYNSKGILKHINVIGLPFDFIGVGPLEGLREKHHIDKTSIYNKLSKELCD